MALSKEYAELKARCLLCASQGYQIGHADGYVAALQADVGEPELPQGMVPKSPEHLLLLIDMVEKGEVAVKAPKAAPKRAPEPAPVVEVAEATDVVEAVEVSEAVEAPAPEPSKPSKKSRR